MRNKGDRIFTGVVLVIALIVGAGYFMPKGAFAALSGIAFRTGFSPVATQVTASGVDGIAPVGSASGPSQDGSTPVPAPATYGTPGPAPTNPPPAPVATPGPTGSAILGDESMELCQSSNYWLPKITQWATPPGCYGQIYAPNPANYPVRPSWGYCNWWVEELHPNLPNYQAIHLPRHHTPLIGATVWFAPGEQGASLAGHYAEVVAINADGYWLLISEMNDTWRGGGWGRVNYRYVHLSPAVWFLY